MQTPYPTGVLSDWLAVVSQGVQGRGEYSLTVHNPRLTGTFLIGLPVRSFLLSSSKPRHLFLIISHFAYYPGVFARVFVYMSILTQLSSSNTFAWTNLNNALTSNDVAAFALSPAKTVLISSLAIPVGSGSAIYGTGTVSFRAVTPFGGTMNCRFVASGVTSEYSTVTLPSGSTGAFNTTALTLPADAWGGGFVDGFQPSSYATSGFGVEFSFSSAVPADIFLDAVTVSLS